VAVDRDRAALDAAVQVSICRSPKRAWSVPAELADSPITTSSVAGSTRPGGSTPLPGLPEYRPCPQQNCGYPRSAVRSAGFATRPPPTPPWGDGSGGGHPCPRPPPHYSANRPRRTQSYRPSGACPSLTQAEHPNRPPPVGALPVPPLGTHNRKNRMGELVFTARPFQRR